MTRPAAAFPFAPPPVEPAALVRGSRVIDPKGSRGYVAEIDPRRADTDPTTPVHVRYADQSMQSWSRAELILLPPWKLGDRVHTPDGPGTIVQLPESVAPEMGWARVRLAAGGRKFFFADRLDEPPRPGRLQ